jgi:hypothetical protein
MTNEQLRMQMLSGIITEGEYKAKLQEDKSMDFSAKDQKDWSEKKSRMYDSWANSSNELKDLEDDLKKAKGRDDKEEIKRLNNRIAQKKIAIKTSKEEFKKLNESLNENFVGMGAINNLFAERKKETYEDAFEHFLSQKYALNEVEEDLEEAEMGNIDPAIKNNPAFNKLVSYLKTHPDEAEELKDKEDEIEDVLQNVNEAFKKDGKFYTQDTYGNTKEVDFKTYLKDKGISVAMSAAALGFLGALMAGALGTNTPNEILDAVLVASGIGAVAGATLGEGEEPLKDVSDEKKAEYLVYMTGMSYEDAITAIRRGAKV